VIILSAVAVFFVVISLFLFFRLQGGARSLTFFQQSHSTGSIRVNSHDKNRKIAVRDKDTIDKIVERLDIYNEGVRDLTTGEVFHVSAINITYTSEERDGLNFKTSQGEIISGGDYSIGGDILSIEVYVNDTLAPGGDIEAAFNNQVVLFLVALSTVSPTRSIYGGGSSTIEERMDFYYDLLEEYFLVSGARYIYPIQVI
jgi:hypothetical protein